MTRTPKKPTEPTQEDLGLAEDRKRMWLDSLNTFVDSKLPAAGQSHPVRSGDPIWDGISPRIKEAHDLALVAALRAIERLAEGVAPSSVLQSEFTLFGQQCGGDE